MLHFTWKQQGENSGNKSQKEYTKKYKNIQEVKNECCILFWRRMDVMRIGRKLCNKRDIICSTFQKRDLKSHEEGKMCLSRKKWRTSEALEMDGGNSAVFILLPINIQIRWDSRVSPKNSLYNKLEIFLMLCRY